MLYHFEHTNILEKYKLKNEFKYCYRNNLKENGNSQKHFHIFIVIDSIYTISPEDTTSVEVHFKQKKY